MPCTKKVKHTLENKVFTQFSRQVFKTDFSLATWHFPLCNLSTSFLLTSVIFLGLICAQKQCWAHLLWIVSPLRVLPRHHFLFLNSRITIFVGINIIRLKEPTQGNKSEGNLSLTIRLSFP